MGVNFNNIISANCIPVLEGESLLVEPGGMLAYKNCAMKTTFVAGSLIERAKRYVLGGETTFRNTFTALKNGGWVSLEEQQPGQIISAQLTPEASSLMIRRTALLAYTPNICFETKYLGLSGYMQGKGIATIRASINEGQGQVYFHTNVGVIRAFDIKKGESPVIIDNDMIIAYSEGLSTKLKRSGNLTENAFSGEGLVCEFEGEGTVYVSSGMQTGQTTIADQGIIELYKQISTYMVPSNIFVGLAAAGVGAVYYQTGRSILNDFIAFAEFLSKFKK